MIVQTRFPAISDDNVSPSYGFLPDHPPLKALPSYYSQWDNLATDLSSLIAGKCLRPAVSRLPALSTAHITTQEQLHRAFVVLGFLIHAYVWCDGSDRPEPNVPARLGEPYLEVCERLGMQPTLSYAGLCLWNWQIRDTAAGNAVNGEGNHQVNGVNEHITDGLSNLDNLDCLVSFTGTRDEAAFYLVPIMVEAEGGRLVSLLLEAMKEATQGDNHEKILNALEETQRTLPKMAALMKLLHEQCDPKVFYQLVRPFFPGAKGMEDKGMPDGVVFHRSDGSKLSAKCVGGSAAQSSYFQFVDSALGVKHRPVGTDKGETVFQEMREYMPREHRDFLNVVAKLPSLREYVDTRADDQKLKAVYNGCLEQLSTWRSRHIGVVTTHIVSQARKERPAGEKPDPEEVTQGLSVKDESSLKGTGGSALIPFLKQAKQETLDSRR